MGELSHSSITYGVFKLPHRGPPIFAPHPDGVRPLRRGAAARPTCRTRRRRYKRGESGADRSELCVGAGERTCRTSWY